MTFATMHAIPPMNLHRWCALYLERARRSFSQPVKFDRSLRRVVTACRGRITARQSSVVITSRCEVAIAL
jgi:hypothetical protein